MTTIQEVINSCVTGLPENDCKNLPFCDLEYLFLKIREKSVGEVVECYITCPVTNEKIQSFVDLRNVKVTNKKPKNKIALDSSISVVLAQPTLDVYLKLNKFNIQEDETGVLELLSLCIEEIQSGEEQYYTKDVPHEEVIQFLESLTAKQFKNLLNFLKEIPTIEQKIEYATKDGVKRDITIRGFSDFLELFLVMQI
jgi:TusA-related sulfurtransferase